MRTRQWVSTVVLAAVLAGATASACAQDEGAAVSALAKAFRVAKNARAGDAAEVGPDRDPERRVALAGLATFDSERVAAGLADAVRVVEGELEQIGQLRRATNEELERILVGQLDREDRSIPLEHDRRYDQLRALQRTLVERGENARRLADDLGERIGGLRAPTTLRFLLTKVLPDRRESVPLRLAAARALGTGGAAIVADVAAAVRRAREPDELLALIDALVLAGAAAAPHAEVLVPLLQHANEAVTERAAAALSRLPVAAAVEPMVALVQRSTGMARVRVAHALEVITRQQLGVNPAAWRAWWQQDGAAFVAGNPQLGGGLPSAAPDNGPNYCGIPQHGRAIVYCLDCSGSMRDPVELRGGPASSASPTETRHEACKRELIRALRQLAEDQQFAILWYNDLPHWWQPRMQPATAATVAAAIAFVRGLQPAAMTNIHDALEASFTLAGRGVRDRYYGVDLDTVFLLTDGTPTRPDGSADQGDRILAAVRRWNPLGRVTIHTIGIGAGLDEQFLAALAAENGGEFKRL